MVDLLKKQTKTKEISLKRNETQVFKNIYFKITQQKEIAENSTKKES